MKALAFHGARLVLSSTISSVNRISGSAMSEKKQYYWLKLKRDFFKRHDIRIIEDMPNGEKYLLFYLKLLVESIDHEGKLRFSDTIPYNDTMLGTITATDIDVVRSAVKLFTELGMMEMMDDGTLYMNQLADMTGHETEWAAKKREYRIQNDTKVQLIEDKLRTSQGQKKTMSDKSIEYRDKSKSKDKEKSVFGFHRNVHLTADERGKLVAEYGEDGCSQLIERLSGYKAAKGKTYASDLAAIRNWVIKATGIKPSPPPATPCPHCGKPLPEDRICNNPECPQWEE